MTGTTPNRPDESGTTECIDPELGGRLWRLHDEACPAKLRGRLETHVAFCADCRLQLALERHAEAGLRSGALALPPADSRPSRWVAWSVGFGAAALAASLALLLLLPPATPHERLVLRGHGDPAIERPIADEIILGRRPTVRWTPLPGAARYDLHVESVDGGYRWSVSTGDPAATVPADHELPANTRFRVHVKPVPAHLAPHGSLQTSFRTGGARAWFAHRLLHSSGTVRAVGILGLACLIAGIAGRLVYRWSA
jgi:hypothetical protein